MNLRARPRVNRGGVEGAFIRQEAVIWKEAPIRSFTITGLTSSHCSDCESLRWLRVLAEGGLMSLSSTSYKTTSSPSFGSSTASSSLLRVI